MDTVFLICAAAGGTVMVLQFVLLLTGWGGDEGVGDGLDAEADVGMEFGSDLAGSVPGGSDHLGSSQLFEVLSLRTLTAALAFFGLGGLLSLRTGSHPVVALIVALAAGGGALVVVYYLMKGLYELRHDGTVRIGRALGREGTVYVPIPANNGGMGKVQLQIQNRIMEFAAVTSSDIKLTTGQKVIVTDVVDAQTVRVELLQDAMA